MAHLFLRLILFFVVSCDWYCTAAAPSYLLPGETAEWFTQTWLAALENDAAAVLRHWDADRSPRFLSFLDGIERDSRILCEALRLSLVLRQVHACPTSIYFGNLDVKHKSQELETLALNFYDGKKTFGNWWEWEIGIPLLLSHLAELDPSKCPLYVSRVNKYLPPIPSLINDKGPRGDGANRWHKILARVRLEKASLPWSDESSPHHISPVISTPRQQSTTALESGAGGLANLHITLPLIEISIHRQPIKAVTDAGDGFYEDGSYIFHSGLPAFGSYGRDAIESIVILLTFSTRLKHPLYTLPGIFDLWVTSALDILLPNILEPVTLRGRSLPRARDLLQSYAAYATVGNFLADRLFADPTQHSEIDATTADSISNDSRSILSSTAVEKPIHAVYVIFLQYLQRWFKLLPRRTLSDALHGSATRLIAQNVAEIHRFSQREDVPPAVGPIPIRTAAHLVDGLAILHAATWSVEIAGLTRVAPASIDPVGFRLEEDVAIELTALRQAPIFIHLHNNQDAYSNFYWRARQQDHRNLWLVNGAFFQEGDEGDTIVRFSRISVAVLDPKTVGAVRVHSIVGGRIIREAIIATAEEGVILGIQITSLSAATLNNSSENNVRPGRLMKVLESRLASADGTWLADGERINNVATVNNNLAGVQSIKVRRLELRDSIYGDIAFSFESGPGTVFAYRDTTGGEVFLNCLLDLSHKNSTVIRIVPGGVSVAAYEVVAWEGDTVQFGDYLVGGNDGLGSSIDLGLWGTIDHLWRNGKKPVNRSEHMDLTEKSKIPSTENGHNDQIDLIETLKPFSPEQDEALGYTYASERSPHSVWESTALHDRMKELKSTLKSPTKGDISERRTNSSEGAEFAAPETLPRFLAFFANTRDRKIRGVLRDGNLQPLLPTDVRYVPPPLFKGHVIKSTGDFNTDLRFEGQFDWWR